jgi:hypothetical protein
MRVMGIEALVPRPGTSQAAQGHKTYPYLLRGVAITEPNHVGASDITYIPWRPVISIWWRSSMGQPCSAGLAAVEYDGHAFLPRRAGRGAGATRKT